MIGLKILTTGFASLLFLFGGGQQEHQKQVYFVSSGDQGEQINIDFRDEDGAATLTLRSGDGVLTIDPSEVAAGESRVYTLDNGEEVTLRRLDEGLVLTMNGKDIQLFHGDGEHGEGEHVVIHGEHGDGEHVWVQSGHGEHVWVSDEDGERTDLHVEKIDLSNTVSISGLGDLDEAAKQNIINALRGAGVTKEIRFNSFGAIHGPHGDEMIWVGKDGAHEDGKVKVIQLKDKKFRHKEKVIIKKQKKE